MENIAPALLDWFYKNHRILPFREDPTPLPRLAQRSDAAADTGVGGAAVLRALSGGAAGYPGAGRLR